MQKIIWDKKYDIGNEIIDNQHKCLVEIINTIIDNKEHIKDEGIKDLFNELIHYANIHFHDEEELVRNTDYFRKIEHKLEHREFVAKLEQIELDILFENPNVLDNILFFLSDWLVNHILKSDKELIPFI